MRRRICSAVAVVVVGLVAATPALAEPTGGNAITVTLFNCSGPAGTPSSFDIQKEPNPGVAAHVVGETFLFKRTSLTFVDTGESVIWGPKTAEKAIITCMVVVPSGSLAVVTGFFTGS